MNAKTWNLVARAVGETFFERHSERLVTRDIMLRMLAMAAEAGSNTTLQIVYPAACVYCAEGESDLTYYAHLYDDGWYHGSKDRSEPKRCGASRIRAALTPETTPSTGGGNHGS